MSKQVILFFFLLLIFKGYISAQEVYEHQYLVKVGDTAPDFETELSNGKTFKLSEQKGKVVMIQFTASWCSVCRKEMPFIEKDIWQVHKNDDFVLVGMDYKETPDKVLQFAIDMKINYPLGIDTSGAIFHQYAQEGAGVTRNIIIDKDGKIIALTRLFDQEEFDAMKMVIFKAVKD